MGANQDLILKRQHYYWIGKNCEKVNNVQGAIEAYIEYAKHLDEADKHVPQKWISNLYSSIGRKRESLNHLKKFAIGCSPPKAAEVYKELGEKYIEQNNIVKAISSFELALKNNPNIGLKSKLEELKSS